jgi:hypothetical protein
MEIDFASARPERWRGTDQSGHQDREPVIVEHFRHWREGIDLPGVGGLEAPT